MSKQVIYIIPTTQLSTFTMPAGFEPTVEAHLWGAGGGTGTGATTSVTTTQVVNNLNYNIGISSASISSSSRVTATGQQQVWVGGMGYPGNPLGGSWVNLTPNYSTSSVTTTTTYPGFPGGGGSYVKSILNVNAGDTVQLVVGQAGKSSTSKAGAAGGRSYISGMLSGGNGGTGGYDEDGEGGGGGGGGGATALVLNGYIVAVAAGGGGGGGYGEDSAEAYPGLPGDDYPSVTSTLWYRVSHPAWSSLLNNYGIWGPFPHNVVVNFPVTGTYTFNFSVDNYGSVSLDGTALITRTGEHNYESSYTATATVSAGNHTITVAGYNISGPAGVAVQIIKPDASELWNTTALVYTSGLTDTSMGGNGRDGVGGGGGGGGGLFGAVGGFGSGDDSTGGGGGEGGLSYGTTIKVGNGTVSGGQGTIFDPTDPVGHANQNGYAVLVFTRRFGIQIKDTDWKQVENAFIKYNSAASVEQNASATYSTPGNYTLNIPKSIKAVNLTYLTSNGLVSTVYNVPSSGKIELIVGDFGQASKFGTLSIPGYAKDVFNFVGNNDDLDDTNFTMVTQSGASYTGSGTSGALTAGAAAKGIYYAETNERYHGDLGATISIRTVNSSAIVSGVRAYISSFSGRYGPPDYAYFLQQPTQSNNYVAVFRVYDPGSSEGSYNYTIGLQQQGYIKVDYTIPADGGWKPIDQIWTKVRGHWLPVTGSDTLTVTTKREGDN